MRLVTIADGVKVSPAFLHTVMQKADYGRWAYDVQLSKYTVSFAIDPGSLHEDPLIYSNITLEDVAVGMGYTLTKTPQVLRMNVKERDLIADNILRHAKDHKSANTTPAQSGYIMQVATLGKVMY